MTSLISSDNKTIAESLYESGVKIFNEMKTDDINETLIITTLISELIKLIEPMILNKKPLTGTNKKNIVLYVGRKILNNTLEGEHKLLVLNLYDLTAEPILEQMVNVSKNVNIIIKKVSKWCCSLC